MNFYPADLISAQIFCLSPVGVWLLFSPRLIGSCYCFTADKKQKEWPPTTSSKCLQLLLDIKSWLKTCFCLSVLGHQKSGIPILLSALLPNYGHIALSGGGGDSKGTVGQAYVMQNRL
jgi:hypothetical protein